MEICRNRISPIITEDIAQYFIYLFRRSYREMVLSRRLHSNIKDHKIETDLNVIINNSQNYEITFLLEPFIPNNIMNVLTQFYYARKNMNSYKELRKECFDDNHLLKDQTQIVSNHITLYDKEKQHIGTQTDGNITENLFFKCVKDCIEPNFPYDHKTEDIMKLQHKIESITRLLYMIGGNDQVETIKKLSELSKDENSCQLLNNSGVTSWLITFIYQFDIGTIFNKVFQDVDLNTINYDCTNSISLANVALNVWYGRQVDINKLACIALKNLVILKPKICSSLYNHNKGTQKIIELLNQLNTYLYFLIEIIVKISNLVFTTYIKHSGLKHEEILVDTNFREHHVNIYSESDIDFIEASKMINSDIDINDKINIIKPPVSALTSLFKLSFDQDNRNSMIELGCTSACSLLYQLDYFLFNRPIDKSVDRKKDRGIQMIHACGNIFHKLKFNIVDGIKCCVRYCGMIITNLTFSHDSEINHLLCSQNYFLRALLNIALSKDIHMKQICLSIIRNITWRLDDFTIKVLTSNKYLEFVPILFQVIKDLAHCIEKENSILGDTNMETMKKNKEIFIISLNAMWNLTNQTFIYRKILCSSNAVLFFRDLTISSNMPQIVTEICGGIFKHLIFAMVFDEKCAQDYLNINNDSLFSQNTISALVTHLRSSSLNIVSNACAIICSMSQILPNRDIDHFKSVLKLNGALTMFNKLLRSKHKTISTYSWNIILNLYSNILTDKLEFLDENISNKSNEEIYLCNTNLKPSILNQTIERIFDGSLCGLFNSSKGNNNYQDFMDVKGRFYDQENNVEKMYEDENLKYLPEQTPMMFSPQSSIISLPSECDKDSHYEKSDELDSLASDIQSYDSQILGDSIPTSSPSPLQINPISIKKYSQSRNNQNKLDDNEFEDAIKTYATEGTPYHATRPPSPSKNDPVVLMKETQYYFTQQNPFVIQNNLLNDDEELKAYYVEDTPATYSKSSSFDNILPISSNNFVNDIKDFPRIAIANYQILDNFDDNTYYNINKQEYDDEFFLAPSIHSSKPHNQVSSSLPKNVLIDHIFHDDHINNSDRKYIFQVENTPMIFSHHDSLDALSPLIIEDENDVEIDSHKLFEINQSSNNKKIEYDDKSIDINYNMNLISDVIISSNKNDSNHTSSQESLTSDPSPLDKALLDQCIISALPKNYNPLSFNLETNYGYIEDVANDYYNTTNLNILYKNFDEKSNYGIFENTNNVNLFPDKSSSNFHLFNNSSIQNKSQYQSNYVGIEAESSDILNFYDCDNISYTSLPTSNSTNIDVTESSSLPKFITSSTNSLKFREKNIANVHYNDYGFKIYNSELCLTSQENLIYIENEKLSLVSDSEYDANMITSSTNSFSSSFNTENNCSTHLYSKKNIFSNPKILCNISKENNHHLSISDNNHLNSDYDGIKILENKHSFRVINEPPGFDNLDHQNNLDDNICDTNFDMKMFPNLLVKQRTFTKKISPKDYSQNQIYLKNLNIHDKSKKASKRDCSSPLTKMKSIANSNLRVSYALTFSNKINLTRPKGLPKLTKRNNIEPPITINGEKSSKNTKIPALKKNNNSNRKYE
ncbi:protein PF3D7_1417600-like isoform X2 [Gordionus sp. m RMFG-2023]